MIFFGVYKPWKPEIEEQQVLKSDAEGYNEMALDLVKHYKFMDKRTSRLSAIRTPLYPVFIAAIYKFAGERPWVVLLVQILVDTASCLILYLMLYPFFADRKAFITALFFAVNPFLVKQCCIPACETLFVFFLFLTAYFFTRALAAGEHKHRMLNYGLTGLLLGLTTLVKPISLYLPFFMLLFLFYIYRRQLKHAAVYSLLFILIFTGTVLPWFCRNYNVYGYFSFSVSGSYNLLTLNVASMEAISQKKRLDRMKIKLLEETDRRILAQGKDPEKLNPFEKAEYWQEVGLEYIKKKPFQFFKTYVKGVFSIFTTLGSSTFRDMLHVRTAAAGTGDTGDKNRATRFQILKSLLSKEKLPTLIIALVLGLYLLLLYASTVIGWITYARSRGKYNKAVLLFFIFMALYFTLVTGAAGLVAARFKIPVLPFLFPFGAVGIDTLLNKLRRKKGVEG